MSVECAIARRAEGAASGLVTATLIDGCVDRLREVMESVARDVSINQSGVLYVVVLDPAAVVRQTAFESAILVERGFGKPREQWDFDYAGAARDKARLSWIHGCDSSVLHALHPHRLQHEQSLLWGSVNLDGIVVAVSGAMPEFDEALSGMLAMLVRAAGKRALRERLDAGAIRLR